MVGVQWLAFVLVDDPGLALGDVLEREIGRVAPWHQAVTCSAAVSRSSSSVSTDTPASSCRASTTSSRSGCRRSASPVAGREDTFYRWEFDAAAEPLPDEVIDYYVRTLSNSGSLRGSFGWYRALDATIAQTRSARTGR